MVGKKSYLQQGMGGMGEDWEVLFKWVGWASREAIGWLEVRIHGRQNKWKIKSRRAWREWAVAIEALPLYSERKHTTGNQEVGWAQSGNNLKFLEWIHVWGSHWEHVKGRLWPSQWLPWDLMTFFFFIVEPSRIFPRAVRSVRKNSERGCWGFQIAVNLMVEEI